MSKIGILNFVKAANDMVNAKTTSTEGLERWLTSWFCMKFNTTPNDDRLQEMTLEELITFFYMHKIQESPDYVEKISFDQDDDFEAWLQKEMGEGYLSDEQMVEEMLQYENEVSKDSRELPDKITTDFTALNFEEE